MSIKAAILAAFVALSGASAAQAQNFTNMDLTAMNNAFNARQNGAMNAQTQNMIQSNLNNPQVMAGYRAGICGPGLTPEQYAYKYAATGGCTPQGYARYNGVTTQIGNDERAARDGYYRSIENYRNAFNGYTNGFSANQQEQGRVMGGNMTYTDPATGGNVQLQYLQPGQSTYDRSTGRGYAMAPNGQYYSTNGNGTWTPIYPSNRSPR